MPTSSKSLPTMDKTALESLTRAGLQAVAKCNGVKANSTTAQIIKDLLAIKQPLKFPCPQNPSISSKPTEAPAGASTSNETAPLRRSRRVIALRAAVAGATTQETPMIDMGVGTNVFSYRGVYQLSERARELAAEQWNDIDDESSSSDASSDFEGPASPWKPGKVYPKPDDEGNVPTLQPVPEWLWQIVRDNAGGLKDATGDDAFLSTGLSLALATAPSNASEEEVDTHLGEIHRGEGSEGLVKAVRFAYQEAEYIRSETPTKGKRRAREEDQEASPTRRTRRREVYHI